LYRTTTGVPPGGEAVVSRQRCPRSRTDELACSARFASRQLVGRPLAAQPAPPASAAAAGPHAAHSRQQKRRRGGGAAEASVPDDHPLASGERGGQKSTGPPAGTRPVGRQGGRRPGRCPRQSLRIRHGSFPAAGQSKRRLCRARVRRLNAANPTPAARTDRRQH